MSHHIAERAGFLAALSKQDPERMLAEEHALACADCREALDEGARLLALLQRALPLGARAGQSLSGQQVPAWSNDRSGVPSLEERLTDKGASHQLAWVTAGAVVVAWVFQLAVGSGFQVSLKSTAVSLGVLTVALAGAILMRGKERLIVVGVVAMSGLFAYLSGTGQGLQPGIGIRCAFRELWAVAITWGIVMTVARHRGQRLGRWEVTAVAATGALAAHAGQHLACEVPHSDAHLLIFHFGGVVLAIALAAASAGWGPGRRPALTVTPGA